MPNCRLLAGANPVNESMGGRLQTLCAPEINVPGNFRNPLIERFGADSGDNGIRFPSGVCLLCARVDFPKTLRNRNLRDERAPHGFFFAAQP